MGGTRRAGMRQGLDSYPMQHRSVNTDGGWMAADVWNWICDQHDGAPKHVALLDDKENGCSYARRALYEAALT